MFWLKSPVPSHSVLNVYSCSKLQHYLRAYATITQDTQDSGKPKNPYPYPKHSRPTPYQIFHLKSGATQAEIKSRYYELVKTHHPDSHHASHLESEIAHSRFQSIQVAYDFLRGKTVSPHVNARPTQSSKGFDPYVHEMAKRRRAYYSRHGDPFEEDEKTSWKDSFDGRTIWHEDGWRERLIFGLGVVTLVAGLFPSMPSTLVNTLPSISVPPHTSSPQPQAKSPNSYSLPFVDLDKGHREAVSALVQARHEREKYGEERREGVRKRVKEMSDPCEKVDEGPPKA